MAGIYAGQARLARDRQKVYAGFYLEPTIGREGLNEHLERICADLGIDKGAVFARHAGDRAIRVNNASVSVALLILHTPLKPDAGPTNSPVLLGEAAKHRLATTALGLAVAHMNGDPLKCGGAAPADLVELDRFIDQACSAGPYLLQDGTGKEPVDMGRLDMSLGEQRFAA